MKNLLSNIQTVLKSPSKKETIFDIIICVLFGLVCYSIPTCSFLNKLNAITWILTACFLIVIAIKILFINKIIHIDLFVISFVLFALVIIISSLLNGFINFSFTAVLMIAATCLIYMFAKTNKYLIRSIIFALFISTALFLITFFASNFNSLIHLNFTRLGSEFGNVNDVAIFLGLGMALSAYYLFVSKKIYFKITLFLLLILFVFCGLSTGTRILIFAFAVCLAFVTIFYFGKKRWYISLILLGGLVLILVILLSLPAFSSIRQRLLSMFETLFGIQTSSTTYVDYSSIDRLNMFFNGFEMMLRKPLFGYGFHGFHNYSSFGGAWSHNNFSETLVCFGVAGTLLYFYPFVISLLNIPKAIRDTKTSLIYPTILLFFLTCMFTFAFDVQKLFSFSIGFVYAFLCNPKCILTIELTKKIHIQKSEVPQL